MAWLVGGISGKNEDGWLMVILVCGCCLGSRALSPFLFSFFFFFIKGKQAKEAIWPENVEIVSSPCFIWLFY